MCTRDFDNVIISSGRYFIKRVVAPLARARPPDRNDAAAAVIIVF